MHQIVFGIVIGILSTIAQAGSWPMPAEPSPTAGFPHNIRVCEDVSGEPTIRDIALLASSSDSCFVPLEGGSRLLVKARAVQWLEIEAGNETPAPLALRLLLGSPGLQRIDFYRQQEAGWHHAQAGEGVPASAHEHVSRLPSYPFVLAPAERTRIFVRMQSSRPVALWPRLQTERAYQELEDQGRLWDGLLFGGLLALAWGALLISAFSRRLPFLILALQCVGIALYEAAMRGYAKRYLWPESTVWADRSTMVLGYGSTALFIAFLISVSAHEKIAMPWRRHFIALAALECLMAVAAALGSLDALGRIGMALNLLVGLSVVAAACVLLTRMVPTGRLMLLTAGFVMLHLVLRTTEHFGWTPSFFQQIGNGDVSTNPLIALIGLGINLTLMAAWINHARLQRKAAHDELDKWQQQEQHRLQDEVARQTHALNQALAYADAKNRQRSEMLGYISHDLRAPLATMLGYARRLGQTAPAQQGPYLRAIERSAHYQITLIDELLEYAKGELQPLQIVSEPVQTQAFLEDIVQHALSLSAQQHNEFVFRPATPLPASVSVDGRRLRQVLLNLLSNAAKFTRHGTIQLIVGAERADGAWLLRFAVVDTGIGIEPKAQASVFNAFTQFGTKGSGVGLGLFIGQRIVEGMGGELLVNSAPGEGSQFSFAIRAQGVDDTLIARDALCALSGRRSARPPAPPRAPYPLPPAHARMALATFARDGRLTDIEAWVDGLADSAPAYPEFLRDIRAALQILDLARIESLALSTPPGASATGPCAPEDPVGTA